MVWQTEHNKLNHTFTTKPTPIKIQRIKRFTGLNVHLQICTYQIKRTQMQNSTKQKKSNQKTFNLPFHLEIRLSAFHFYWYPGLDRAKWDYWTNKINRISSVNWKMTTIHRHTLPVTLNICSLWHVCVCTTFRSAPL